MSFIIAFLKRHFYIFSSDIFKRYAVGKIINPIVAHFTFQAAIYDAYFTKYVLLKSTRMTASFEAVVLN